MIEALRSIGVDVEVADGGQTLSVERRDSDHPNCLDSRPTPTGALHCQQRHQHSLFDRSAFRLWAAAIDCMVSPECISVPLVTWSTRSKRVIDGEVGTESPASVHPVWIDSRGWSGHAIEVAGSVSSQFLERADDGSTDCRLAPKLRSTATRIGVVGELVSRPYVDMTAEVMRSFGAGLMSHQVTRPRTSRSRSSVAAQPYRGRHYAIEPDASAASYFWATAAITGGTHHRRRTHQGGDAR